MFYYVYRITNKILNKHYYGFRSCKIHPKEDLGVKYISTSTDKSFICDQKENPQNYKYKVVKIFNNKVDAINLEIKLHNKFNVGTNESFYNLAKQTSTKFTTAGISAKIQRSKEYRLKHGWPECKICGKLHNKLYCCSRECFYEYIKHEDNEFSKTLSNSRSNYIKNNLETIKLNAKKGSEKRNQKEINEKIKTTRQKNKLGNSNVSSKHILIYDNNNKLVFESTGNFKKFCKDNNLPYIRCCLSYKLDRPMLKEFNGWRVKIK